VDPLPADVPDKCWWRSHFPNAAINHYPDGDLNVNMLPTMEGREAFDLGTERAYAECRRRVLAHWHHSQTVFPEFQAYQIKWVAPTLGVRETRRVVGRYMLTEQDVRAGLDGQTHDDIIAIADHAMDTHGPSTGRAGCGEVTQPYGIPYRCLLAADVDNLLLACRGASFTSLAASSCRLSRTMMQLGQAAGTAAVLARRRSAQLADVPPADLRQALAEQHVQLDWPMPAEMREHLINEE